MCLHRQVRLWLKQVYEVNRIELNERVSMRREIIKEKKVLLLIVKRGFIIKNLIEDYEK